MLHFTFFVIGLCAIQSTFTSQVEVTFVDFQILFADKEYFKDVDAYVVEDRTTFFNVTLLKRLPENATSNFAMKGRSNAEYVIPTALDFETKLCDLTEDTPFVSPSIQAFKFDKGNCPPEPGVYTAEHTLKDTTNLPDSFVPNSYAAELRINNDDHILLSTILQLHLD